VHLVDAHYCLDPSMYVSMLLVSLRAMLHLELPHVNILSKIDLIERYGKLPLSLEFYTQVQDLNYLLVLLESDPFGKKYKKLSHALVELVQDFGLVGYQTLCIQDKKSVVNVARLIDKANGFVFGGLDETNAYAFADTWDQFDDYNRQAAEEYTDQMGQIIENEDQATLV
jgi:hypothetical protein